jgi:predicted TPR repeat methyltransferase
LLNDGVARHRAGDLDAAERLYRQAAAASPGNADAHNLLGVVARQRGDARAALRHTERALALQPDAPVFLANHGGALAEAGDLRGAVGFLRAALRRRPDDPVALRNLGQALAALGDPRAALEPLERAVALAPDAVEPRLALAHARREAGEAEGAAAAAEAALALAAPDTALAAQARFLLAALGRAAVPDRAPAGYVRDLFDGFAERFDADLAGELGYRTPELLAAALRDSGAPTGQGRGLDLGCGTGLSGVALAPLVRRLEGLDLSPRMLAQARRRVSTPRCTLADLLEWLPATRSVRAGRRRRLPQLPRRPAPGPGGHRRAFAPGLAWRPFSLEAGEEGAPSRRWGGDHALSARPRLRGAPRRRAFEVVAQREASCGRSGRAVAGVLMVLRRGG